MISDITKTFRVKELVKRARLNQGMFYLFCLSLSLEEIGHQGGALFCQDSVPDFGFWMEEGRREHGIASLGIGGPIDYPTYLCPVQSSGAHGTWLHGDVECAVGKIFPAHRLGGGGDCDHLGVRRRIMQAFSHVVPTTDYPATTDNHRSDGNLILFKRQSCLL